MEYGIFIFFTPAISIILEYYSLIIGNDRSRVLHVKVNTTGGTEADMLEVLFLKRMFYDIKA